MIDFLLFLMGSVGFTMVFVLSSIFEKVRSFLSFHSFIEELIHCPMCFGFWVGVCASFYSGYSLFFGGFAVSLISWVVYNIVAYYITKTNFLDSKMEGGTDE